MFQCRQVVLLVCCALLLPAGIQAQQSSPVNCREALRPILLQVEPDRTQLPDIRDLCQGQADAGDPDALYQLALLHLGLLDWRPESAIPMIRRAAVAGIPEAQYWLAWQYESGPLLANESGSALYWYRAAGDQEHRLALNRLIEIYSRGELGEAVDEKLAAGYRVRLANCMQQEANLSDGALRDPAVSTRAPSAD